jgi:hypothetical protein
MNAPPRIICLGAPYNSGLFGAPSIYRGGRGHATKKVTFMMMPLQGNDVT